MEELREVREFKSFGSMVSADGFMEAELKYSPRGGSENYGIPGISTFLKGEVT